MITRVLLYGWRHPQTDSEGSQISFDTVKINTLTKSL